jgi:hypothetical protein
MWLLKPPGKILKVNAKTPRTPSKAAKNAVDFSPLSELGVPGVLAFKLFCSEL